MEFLVMTKPIESNDKTQMDFQHPLPCAPFLGWAIFYRLKNAEMLLQAFYRLPSTLLLHIQFISPLFPDWTHLGFPVCQKVILAFSGTGMFSSSEELSFYPTKILPLGSFPVLTHILLPPGKAT